jgi:hypothetical protein
MNHVCLPFNCPALCSLCTVDGQRYSEGDSKDKFSLQSVSMPFTYALRSHPDLYNKYGAWYILRLSLHTAASDYGQ